MLSSKVGICSVLFGFHVLVTMNSCYEKEEEVKKLERCREKMRSSRRVSVNLETVTEFSKYRTLEKEDLFNAMKESYLLDTNILQKKNLSVNSSQSISLLKTRTFKKKGNCNEIRSNQLGLPNILGSALKKQGKNYEICGKGTDRTFC
eukprot:snap_masked-scaffold_6-processed-gene-4.45-mRNA-1 protein AED:1.00 eAED:1.00 QI:0/0/0/0/1/1/2/0/147